MAIRRHGNNSTRPFGCMPKTDVTPCGHVPPKKHKARGMCHTCYKRWRVSTGRESYKRSWRSGRRKSPPVKRVPGPRGDRTETWLWAKDCLDIANESDDLYMRQVKEYWAVELMGAAVTGAFGPLESPQQCAWAVTEDRIIRNPVVIGVLERRRDEFERLAS